MGTGGGGIKQRGVGGGGGGGGLDRRTKAGKDGPQSRGGDTTALSHEIRRTVGEGEGWGLDTLCYAAAAQTHLLMDTTCRVSGDIHHFLFMFMQSC